MQNVIKAIDVDQRCRVKAAQSVTRALTENIVMLVPRGGEWRRVWTDQRLDVLGREQQDVIPDASLYDVKCCFMTSLDLYMMS